MGPLVSFLLQEDFIIIILFEGGTSVKQVTRERISPAIHVMLFDRSSRDEKAKTKNRFRVPGFEQKILFFCSKPGTRNFKPFLVRVYVYPFRGRIIVVDPGRGRRGRWSYVDRCRPHCASDDGSDNEAACGCPDEAPSAAAIMVVTVIGSVIIPRASRIT